MPRYNNGSVVGYYNQTSVSGSEIRLADNAVFPGTEAIRVPSGTTAQRPSSPVNGSIRYNSTTGYGEIYQSGAWHPLSKKIGIYYPATISGHYAGSGNPQAATARNGDVYTFSASSQFNTDYAAGYPYFSAYETNFGVVGSNNPLIVFNYTTHVEWATNGQNTNFWSKVQLPRATVIRRVIVRGRASGESPNEWRIDASNDDSNWTTLLDTSDTIAMSTTANIYDIPDNAGYIYWRMFAVDATSGSNPGCGMINYFVYI